MENNKIKTPQTITERKNSKSRCQELKNEIDRISGGIDLTEYSNDVNPLLEEYKSLGSIQKILNFTSKNTEVRTSDSEAQADKRHKIIYKYLEIARKYIPIDVIRDLPNDNKCPGCGLDFSEAPENENEIQTCPNPSCNIIRYGVAKSSLFKDSLRVNAKSKNDYEDRDNFLKGFIRYQGRQPIKLPSELFDKLDEWFMSYRLPVGDDVKKFPLREDGSRETTSLPLLMKALLEKGYSLYEDRLLIAAEYWGWVLPDIMHLQEAIMIVYDKVIEQYKLLNKERKSKPNTQVMLYEVLMNVGHKCDLDRFKIVKTDKSVDEHESLLRQSFEKAGYKYYSIK